MVTEVIRSRMVWVITGVLALLVLLALPAKAESADYETTLDRLGRLQALAEQYIEEKNSGDDPIDLTLSFTRVGDYNTTVWQLTAGTRDGEFEKYATDADPDLWDLQGMNTVELPNGQGIDFGHLLAAMNLVYRGMPIAGSWGGDCMQLAKAYYGQASDEAGYADVMRATFAKDDDGSVSVFGDQDLRADIDSINVGAELTKDTDIATALRDYYQNLSANVVDYARAKQFIILNFGTVDTSSTAFADAVYSALLEDSGMQLLFYMNGMWTVKGWQIKDDYAPAVRGATDLFAEYLANAVNHEKIKSETNDRLVAMGGQALADALEALGDTDAAQAALTAAEEMANNAQSTVSSGSDVVSAARENLQTNFNVKVFQLILLIAAGLAAFMLVFSMVMFVVHRKEN